MKKKIIISLILAMCCVVSSIPVNASARGNVCVEHGPFRYECCSNIGSGATAASGETPTLTTHRYKVNGRTLTCEYIRFNAVTYQICDSCSTVMPDGNGGHGHGGWDHDDTNLCGGANVRGCFIN